MKYVPHDYQAYCIQRVVEDPAVGLFLRPGLGKTVITLSAVNILKYFRWQVQKVLVVAPKKVAEATWSKEAAKWDHLQHLRTSVVLGSATKRIKALNTPADIYVINRENVEWLVDYYKQAWPFDMVVLDESTSFKNSQSKRWKAMRRVRRFIKRMVLLTGTPSSKGLIDLWAQVYLLDCGERLGQSLSAYRERYFDPDQRSRTQIFSYKAKDGAESAVLDAISDICISMKAEDYTPGNGNNTVGTLQRAIFLLSATELNRSASWFNVEGTALEIASSLQIAYMNGSAVVQWTRSPNTRNTRNAVCLDTDGNVDYDDCAYTYGSRPAFTLPSTLSVSDDGTVSVNTAPTITSSTANGSNLGTKTAGFNFQYTVNDVDGDTVTVKEYLDNVLKRTYTAILGQVNTFQAVTAANWQKILNGSHTLKVVASDGKADSAAYTVTFAKKVTKATVTLAAPLAADDAISVMVMNIVGTLPADAVMEVLVTNNAKDTTPVWEDATADVKNGANHVFTNKTAANGFAFNFKLSVERGASDTGGYISNIGGAFE